MQVAILAGGLGTRLGALTARQPKSMVRVGDRPFLDHQVELLRRQGVDEVVLCVGHLAEVIRAHVGDGRWLGVRVRVSDEGERRLGTGGALKWAEPLLADRFFVLFGDSYLRVDYRAVMARLETSGRQGVMVVWRNAGYEKSDVAVEGEVVTRYGGASDGTTAAAPAFINYGLTALRRSALAHLMPGKPCSLQDTFAPLITARQLGAFEVAERYYEIGSPRGLEEFASLGGAT
jgi:NDP-sugar pyrophosphorylase family protein